MASATLAEVKAYLALDGDDFDIILNLMLPRAESYVRRLATIGDEVETDGSYSVAYPDALKLPQLLIAKWMFDRRESPNDGKSPPSLIGYLGEYERTGDEEEPNRVRQVATPSDAQIEAAVDEYFAENPLQPAGVLVRRRILDAGALAALADNQLELLPASVPPQYIVPHRAILRVEGAAQVDAVRDTILTFALLWDDGSDGIRIDEEEPFLQWWWLNAISERNGVFSYRGILRPEGRLDVGLFTGASAQPVGTGQAINIGIFHRTAATDLEARAKFAAAVAENPDVMITVSMEYTMRNL